jgi:hypothetical protein
MLLRSEAQTTLPSESSEEEDASDKESDSEEQESE